MSGAFVQMPRLLGLLASFDKAAGVGDAPLWQETISRAREEQGALVPALLDVPGVSEEGFLKALADSLGIHWWGELEGPLEAKVRDVLPARVALRYQLLPVEVDEETGAVWVLTYDPLNLLARQAVVQSLRRPVMWAMATRRQILKALREAYGVGADTFEDLLDGRDIDEALADLRQETTVLDEENSEASVVKFVNQIIREALEQRATDIHIEPLENGVRVRSRIDGVLHEMPVPARINVLQASVISRIKIMAHLDIAERRLPQDGRINLELDGQSIDVRVATIPSVAGESVSMRLLGREQFDFQRLGLDARTEGVAKDLLAMPNGIVLVTGPTGCGKSTTLYTFLSSLNTKDRRIVTIEDPVEYKLPGVVQIAVRPEIGLTFAAGLRSILRGDPNVIMVGEMRDLETAEIAIRSALTGHLVFSTLHTNDAVGGITRLIEMGVEPFLVSSAVRAFIAQRLVRVLCPDCRQPVEYPQAYLKGIGFPALNGRTLYKPGACEKCRNMGYLGRSAIYEMCLVTSKMQDLISQNKSGGALKAQAMRDGMLPLRPYGWQRVLDGMTTVEEVLRVTAADADDATPEG